MNFVLWSVAAKVAAFRALEALADWRSPRSRVSVIDGPEAGAIPLRSPALWIFASTIGELNAIEPFIHQLLAKLGDPPLTLISDRGHYGEAYRAKFPRAAIEVVDGSHAQAQALARRIPPRMLVLAEIPCLLHDAPCRFSYATVRAARLAGARTVVVNGWLYGYSPPSRLDIIENSLFRREYLQGFDLMLVQTEAVRQTLLQKGADSERVAVTGNIKFDAMLQPLAAPVNLPLLDALRVRDRGPVVVAGSVSDIADWQGLLASFKDLLNEEAEALLVLAPRHPENHEQMKALSRVMDSSHLRWKRRSRFQPAAAVDAQALVLDTIGELRGCYAAATLAYVGTDHNVLEPLAFGKPVFVSGRWDPTYPSYPVYRALLDAGVVRVAVDAASLGPEWRELARLARTGRLPASIGAVIAAALASLRGAAQRSITRMDEAGLLLEAGQEIAK